MRIHERNWILLGLVLLCVVTNALLRPAERHALERTPLFAQLDLRAAGRIVVSGEGEDLLVLERGDEGWILASLHGFPAHAWVVDELLARLRGITTESLVSDDPQAHALFGVADGARHVRVETGEGRLLAELLVGPGPEGRGSHVRLPQAPEVYRSPALAYIELDPRRYLEAGLLEFDPAALTRLGLALPGEGLVAELERLDDGRWRTAGGRLLTPARIEPLIAWASHLYLSEVVARETTPAHGLGGEGWARLVLTEEGESGAHELVVGAEVPDGLGDRFATSPGWERPWVVTVSAQTAERLRDLARALAR